MLDVVYFPPHTAGRMNGGEYARLVNIAETPAGSRSNLSAKMSPLAFLARASFVDHDCHAEAIAARQLLEPNSVAGGYIDDQRIG